MEIEYETLKISKESNHIHYFGILGGPVVNLIPAIEIPEKYIFEHNNIYDYNCDGGRYKAHINANGEVYPCVFAQHTNLKAGNLLNESFIHIWEKGNWAFFRKERNFSNTKCDKCKYFPICRGGCPGIAYDIFKTVDSPDPRCRV